MSCFPFWVFFPHGDSFLMFTLFAYNHMSLKLTIMLQSISTGDTNPNSNPTNYSCSCAAVYCLQCFDAGFQHWTLLVGWQEGHPACKKTEWWGAGVVICLERGADLHMVQLMPLPLTVSCFSKIQIGFTFLVLAHLGSPGQRVVKRVCVCVCVCCAAVDKILTDSMFQSLSVIAE